MKQAYLGDGLYAEFDGYQVRLYVHDGIRATNEVFLDGAVIVSFQAFIKEIAELAR